jgi:hypothetical protein
MLRRVDLVWTDVSEECIASIFRVENPWARNQREQVAADWVTSRKTPSYVWTGSEGEWTTWEINREESERSVEMGQQVADDGGDTFFRNVGSHNIYTAPHPRRRRSS